MSENKKSLLDLITAEKLIKAHEEVEKLKNKKCKSCKAFKGCVNFAGYPAKANDNICPYYVPKKQVPRGWQKSCNDFVYERIKKCSK